MDLETLNGEISNSLNGLYNLYSELNSFNRQKKKKMEIVKVNLSVYQTMQLVQVITQRIEIASHHTSNVQVIF